MSAWTVDQIRQVRSVYVQGVIDLSFADQEGATSALRGQLARRVIDTCHPFGVEVHSEDVSFTQVESLHPMQAMFRARWAPTTHTVELIGGYDDGRTIEFQGAPHDSLKVAVMPSLSLSDLTVETQPTDLTPTSLTFSLSGWREVERHWVYATRDRA